MNGRPGNSMLPAGLGRLFTELTGLEMDLVPAPPVGLEWDTRRLIVGCRAHARRWGGANGGVHCASCARTHLERALASPRHGHRFCGSCGMRLHLLPLAARSQPRGLLVLRDITEDVRLDGGVPRAAARDGRFGRSVRLLRVLARDVALQADTRHLEAEVGRLRQALAGHECEEARLRSALGHRVPGIRRSAATSMRGSRARPVVAQVIERIHRGFDQPLSLKGLAGEYGLNANHLSEVFSREVGVTFKCYLTTLRLQRAQALLRDPHRRMADIGRAVGYGSADRFRAAFRAWTGLSPSLWRLALRVRDET